MLGGNCTSKLKKAILAQNSKAINYEQSKPVFSIRQKRRIAWGNLMKSEKS